MVAISLLFEEGFDLRFALGTQSVEYMHGGNLPPGVLLTFNTNPADTVVGRYSQTDFNLSCFPAGTFPAGVC